MAFGENNQIKIYKRISLGFIILTIILIFFLIYIALSRATIIISPKEETVMADLLVTVKEFNLKDNDIFGRFATTTVSGEGLFISGTEMEQAPGIAGGTVMIYNKAGNNQILIATTRILSESGVLFRLKNKVVVPAGGSVVGEIYADKEGESGNIEPTKFTIPGLSSDLQKKIYAESKEPITGGLVGISALSDQDLEDSTAKLKETLILQVSDDLRKSLNVDGQFDGMAFFGKVVKKETKTGVGAPNEFKLYMTLDVVGVAYSDALKKEAEKTLKDMIASDKVLLSSNTQEMKPIVEKYNSIEGYANLKVSLIGKTIINEESPILDRSKLAGKSKDEVKDYLSKYAGIEGVEIRFFPFWLSSVPQLRDHIKVIVK